ncbi:hypothetical protein NDU88_011436 [Pleurodeles waltl]|uniref:TIR domain-containing protein n=1 Tax=Pleurodeles waltl TaxID=8319 RepID=A0AAV7PYU8_PLEWA|nr:hypothetical protein NDU88_011436 [Pleurodeles waltl]
MLLLWLFLQSGLLLIPGAVSYGFRNCIKSYEHPQHYNCIQRFLQDVRSAVSDLPNETQCLNISHNSIRRLPGGSFRHLPQLRTLRLDFNQLWQIQDSAFENLNELLTLNISNNKIKKLSRGVFQGLRNLTCLLIENNHLFQVDRDTFHLLKSLEVLNLASNSLKNFSLVITSVSPLNRLQNLNLCNNHLCSLNTSTTLPASLSHLYLCNTSITLKDLPPNYFTNVTSLDLSYNHIGAQELASFDLAGITYLLMQNNSDFQILDFLKRSNVPPHSIDYSGVRLHGNNLSDLCKYLRSAPLQKLSLRSNSIRKLSNETFVHCPVIKSFDLSRNKLKRLGCLEFVHRNGLQSLVVQHNLLNALEGCSLSSQLLTSLENLTLSYNRILTVGHNAFSFAPNLTNLNLEFNNIAYLSKHALNGLSKLEILRLDNNLLTDLYEESFASLGNLQHLLLRNNRVAVIFPNTFMNLHKLQILDLGGNKICSLTNTSFSGLQNLSKLYLDLNEIRAPILQSQVFFFVQTTLRVLDLKANNIAYISIMKEISPFENLQNLKVLKIQSQQPYGIKIIPPKFFKGLKSLQDLYLSNNKILTVSHNVFDDLGELRFLDLSDSCNGIQNLPAGIFRNQIQLQTLDLENIGLQSLTNEVFGNLTSLRVLKVMKNALKVVNETAMLGLPKLEYLDLRKCPLSCTCKSQWFKSWLNNSQVQIVYPYNQSCDDGPSAYIYSLDMSVCYSQLGKQCFFGTAPVLLLLMIIPILYTRCYWYMKYNFYIFRAWFRENWSKNGKDTYKYDAFVSYNSNDEWWVLQELVPQLENCSPSSFRLCLHHRDFELGRDIIDNIVDSIYNSRKTICVISRSYLRSEWCSLEIQLASYRLLDQQKDVLVLVFLGKIPERDLSAYHRMRKVMLKKTYICWPPEPDAQKLFWSKVRKAIQSKEVADESMDGLSFNHHLLVESTSLLS